MIRILATIVYLLSITPTFAATILALGDSLTAGLGLDAAESFPAKLEKALRARGNDVTVINAGVSGDTAAMGLDRLDWSLTANVTAVIVELGANDALRGLDPKQAETALDQIVTKVKAKGAKVLLAGMKAPPNLGPDYVKAFDAIYPHLAEKHGVALYPFFLEGVAADPGLNQADGLHPTAQGVDIIVRNVLPAAETLLAK